MISLQAVFGLIDIPLSLAVMRVKAVLSGASSREMLHSHGHSIRSQSLLASLYSRDQMFKNFFDQFWIFSKSTVGSLPSGICGTVCHIHISFLHAYCVPLSPDTVCKVINNMDPVSLYRSSDPHGSRPGGKNAGSVVHTEDYFSVFISGIGYYHHRDKMFPFLSQAVHLIDPVCQFIRFWIAPEDKSTYLPVFNGFCSPYCGAGGKNRRTFLHRLFIQKPCLIYKVLVLLFHTHFPGIQEKKADLLFRRQILG